MAVIWGSGMRNKQPEPRYLAVGRITRPHGVRGELRVEVLTDSPEHLAEVDALYIGQRHQRYEVEGVRPHQKKVLLKLRACNDRNMAETFRGELVYVAVEDAVPLDEDEYYEYELQGLEVVTDAGQFLGEVVEVFTAPGANDVIIVHGPLGEILIPAIEDVVTSLDFDSRRMVIHPLPGLLDGV